MSSSSAAEVQQLVSAGRYAEAVDRLTAAAAKGDTDSTFMLAGWRISGQIIGRDTATARQLMGKAAEVGHPVAALFYAHFLANGTGGAPDWTKARTVLETIRNQPGVADQFAMLERMAIDGKGEPTQSIELQILSEAPGVYCAKAFLTQEECDYLVRSAEPRLQPSLVIDRATGRSLSHPDRRSDGAFFGVGHEDLVVNAINRRIAAASGTRPDQAEPLQILRYGPGDEFRPHFDFVKEGGNQRILTAIVYLTEKYEGGETEFLRTALKFRGHKGDLLLFRNVTEDGRQDPSTEHAGLPVRSGTKIVASRWIWRDPYTVPPPRPFVPGV